MKDDEKQLLKEFQLSWAKNKYWVMGHSQQAYNHIRLIAKGNDWTGKKQKEYEDILSDLEKIDPSDKTLRVAYQHIWGYFKKRATPTEKHQYKQLIESSYLQNNNDLDVFLKELSEKYDQTYLLNMRWPVE